MNALVYLGPDKKALQERPKPTIGAATDAIVKVTRTTICGTDLHIFKGDAPSCPAFAGRPSQFVPFKVSFARASELVTKTCLSAVPRSD